MSGFFVKFIVIPLVSTVVIYLVIAFSLLFSQSMVDLNDVDSISFENVGAEDFEVALTSYPVRSGEQLPVRHIPAKSDAAPLVIMIHGSGWHGGSYLGVPKYLSENGNFEILIPDLRGHGANPKRRGDVDYIGQFEDDLADLITAFGGESRDVYMIGHSSGGGLVIRFAGGEHGSMLKRAVLLAPFLKHDAPTVRENAGGWAHPLLRRIIGLSMLNTVGISWFNHKEIIQFNYPEKVLSGPLGHTATQAYSYRLNTSFAPRNAYLEDIAKLPEFLLLVGREDDAFFADQYEATMSAVTSKGRYEIIDGPDHIGIVDNEAVKQSVLEFLK